MTLAKTYPALSYYNHSSTNLDRLLRLTSPESDLWKAQQAAVDSMNLWRDFFAKAAVEIS